MTRWARGKAKGEHEATGWEDLKKSVNQNKDTQSRKLKNDKNRSNHGKESKQVGEKSTKEVPKWLEKRREARRNRRKKMKPCFHCRQPGHQILECPKRNKEEEAVGICFKCGSSEHKIYDCKVKVGKGEYPFAKCFICKEKGHISSKCPDNPRGLYPDGGGCRFCGSVEHYRRDCPEREINKVKDTTVNKRKLKLRQDNQSADAIALSDVSDDENDVKPRQKKQKVVKI